MKTKIVLKMSVAMKLKAMGYKVLDTMPNRNDKNLIVWVFEETPEFIRDFKKLLINKKIKI